MIKEAKSSKERKFKQSLELIMVFKDIDVKKGFAMNETVQLPKQTGSPATVCVMASGEMGLKAKKRLLDHFDKSSIVNQYARFSRNPT